MTNIASRAHRATVALLALLPACAAAQTWPAKPVRIVHGFAPGSAIDVYARPLSQRLSEALGQQFIVDPRPGATGQIANELVAKATPDGYTLLAGPGSSLTSFPQMQKVPYDALKDLTQITQTTAFSFVLVAHPAVPAKTARDLVALARAKPDFLTYGSTGIGSGFHLAGELFAQMAGVKMLHVPFRGGGTAALPDLIGGRVDLMWDNFGVVRSHVESGRLKAVGTTGIRRIPALAGIPTIAESGLPGYEMVGWHGLLAPAGTPREIVERLAAAVHRIFDIPEVRDFWLAQGVEIPRTTPEQFAALYRAEYARYGKLLQSIGLLAKAR